MYSMNKNLEDIRDIMKKIRDFLSLEEKKAIWNSKKNKMLNEEDTVRI